MQQITADLNLRLFQGSTFFMHPVYCIRMDFNIFANYFFTKRILPCYDRMDFFKYSSNGRWSVPSLFQELNKLSKN